MAVVSIEDDHHVVRFCRKNSLIRDNGVVVGVFPNVFELRPAREDRDQETYLSTIYYEHFSGTHVERMQQCRAAMTIEAKPRDGFAKIRSGSVKQTGKDHSKQLRVTHEGKRGCPAYSKILGLPFPSDDKLCSALAKDAVVDVLVSGTF